VSRIKKKIYIFVWLWSSRQQFKSLHNQYINISHSMLYWHAWLRVDTFPHRVVGSWRGKGLRCFVEIA